MLLSAVIFITAGLNYVHGQTPDQNLEKYWKYRDRFKKNFINIGPDQGQSIPMSARCIGFTFGGDPQNADNSKSRLYFQDATIYLGHYLVMLATEHKMLKDELAANFGTIDPGGALDRYYQSNLNELYYALNALNRLDDNAEAYLRQSPSWPDERNGIFMRDDVGEDFLDPFENDYSDIFQRDCNFQFPSSDYRSVAPYNNPDEGTSAGQVLTYNKRNVQSIDQISSVLLGLRFVYELVGDFSVQPTASDAAMNLRAEARTIALRIINHVMHEASEIDGYSFETRNFDGLKTHDGGSGILFAPLIVQYAKRFNHPVFSGMSQTSINNINVAIQVDPRDIDFCNANFSSNNDFWDGLAPVAETTFEIGCSFFTCRSYIEDLAEEMTADGDLMTIGSIKLGDISNIYFFSIVNDLDISTSEVTTIPGPVLASASIALQNVDWDISYMNCDNINPLAQLLGKWIGLKHLAPLALMSLGDAFNGNQGITSYLIKPSTLTSLRDKINDDNVHMILELLVGSGYFQTVFPALDNHFIDKISYENSFEWYALANKILNVGNIPSSFDIQSKVQTELNSAPCEGPWDSPLTPSNALPTPNTIPGWRAANKLFHPSDSQNGIPDPSFRGEYSGLDYMVMHNLERLAFPVSSLPQFVPSFTCDCVSEFTDLDYTDATLVVDKKFEQYKRQQIVSPSILAHDLTVDGSLGNLAVKNDFIVCGPDPSVPTTLEVKNNARLNIYGGMQIIVKAGNRLKITENAKIVAGIVDPSFPELGSGCTIVLEENAILEISENADIDIIGAFQIRMLDGARLTIRNSVVDVSTLTGTSGVRTFGENTFISINSSSLRNLNPAQKFVIESTNSCNIDIKGSQIQLLNGGFNLKNSVLGAINSYIQCEQSSYEMENCQISLSNTPLQLKSQYLTIKNSSTVELINSNITLNQGQLELKGGPWLPSGRSNMLADGSNIFFNGSNSRFKLNFATLTVAENFQMTISSPNGPSGVFEIVGNDDIDLVLANNNSSLTVLGDGKNVETIRVNNYHDFWSNNGNGKIIFRDLLINLDNAGRIWTSSRLELHNCTLKDNVVSTHSGELEIWNNYLTLQYVDFHKVHVDAIGSSLNVESNNYHGKLAYLWVEGGGYRISRSKFYDGQVKSQKLNFISSISQSEFTQIDGFQDEIAISDLSLVEIIVTNTNIDRYYQGILKEGGILTSRCNNFNKNYIGITNDVSELNLSSTRAAGYNNFIFNDYNIEANQTITYALSKGYNSFEPYNICNIHTNSALPCQASADIYIPADANIWTTDNNGVAIQSNPPSSYCLQWVNNSPHFCNIYFMDYTPVTDNTCPTGKPIVRPKNIRTQTSNLVHSKAEDSISGPGGLRNGTNNLEINTSSFQNVQLDSALTYAASFMEVFDSTGNDPMALTLFHEILSSGLDRTDQEVRDLFEWGLKMMQTTIENMFVNGHLDIDQNQTSFQTDVQNYVDILNLQTDTTLTPETYRSQFRSELMKGQLFLTLKKDYIALEVFENLNNCPLDSLEQVSLHHWKERTQLSIALQNAIAQGFSPDSLLTLNPQNGVPFLSESSQSDYYFGVTINSPNSVTFVSCGNNASYRDLIETTYEASIYPNPTRELLFVKIKENEGIINSLIIHDIFGKLVYSEVINLEGNFTHQVNLPTALASGQYFLRVISADGQSKSFEFIKQ